MKLFSKRKPEPEPPKGGLVVWGRKTSVNVQKVLWTLEELGLDYAREDVGGPFGRLDSPEFAALSPHPAIPVLVDNRYGAPIVVWESAAVNRHLVEAAARGGNDALWPTDLAARAVVDRWAEWAQVNFYPPVRDLFWSVVRTPAAERDPSAIAQAADAARAVAQSAEAAIAAHGHLAADRLTLADVPFAGMLHRFMTLEIERPALPALERYYAALKERPAYAATIVADYEAMRVPGAERAAAPIA